jgi:hypothetical protein
MMESIRADFVDEQGKTRIRKYSEGMEGRIKGRLKQIYAVFSSRISENSRRFEEFRIYFHSNRIFLPPDICSQIDDILERYFMLDWALQIFLDNVPDEGYYFARVNIKKLFDISMNADMDDGDLLSALHALLLRIDEELAVQAKKLEMFYKSVSEV